MRRLHLPLLPSLQQRAAPGSIWAAGAPATVAGDATLQQLQQMLYLGTAAAPARGLPFRRDLLVCPLLQQLQQTFVAAVAADATTRTTSHH